MYLNHLWIYVYAQFGNMFIQYLGTWLYLSQFLCGHLLTTHHPQRHTARKIQNGCQGAQKWPTGSGKESKPRIWGAHCTFAKKVFDPRSRPVTPQLSISSLKVSLHQNRRLYNIWTQLINQWLHQISILQNTLKKLEKFEKALILSKKSKRVQRDLKGIKINQYGLRCFIMVWSSSKWLKMVQND